MLYVPVELECRLACKLQVVVCCGHNSRNSSSNGNSNGSINSNSNGDDNSNSRL